MTSTSVVPSSTDAQAKSNEKTTDSNEAATPASDTVADGKQTGESGDKSETTSSPAKKPTVRKTDWEQGKVYLYQFDRCSKLPSLVSQCLRLETLIRAAGIPYENIDNMMRYRSANGSLPFVELNGKELSDVENIIEELSKEFKDLDSDLTEAQKVTSYSLTSMVLNHTSWVVRCWRYKHPQEFLKVSGVDIKKTINSWVPSPLLNFMFKMGFRSNIKDLIGHGIGNRNPEQIYIAGKKDLQTLSQALGGRKYFFGDKPHSLDCLVFAVLCQFIYVPFEGFDEYIKTETPNLMTFVEKMKEEYWKDWEELCSVAEANNKSVKKEGETDEAKKDEDAIAEEKKKAEDAKKEKEEKKRKEKEEKERKKKEEKEEKERKKREAKEKAAKEKEKATKDEKPAESGDAEAAKKEGGDKGEKSDAKEPENKGNDTKAGDA